MMSTAGRDKELWTIIMEKAWAKVHGSYERINGGCSMTTIRDLTGAPGDLYQLDDEDVDPEDVWEKLYDADKKNYILTAVTMKNPACDILPPVGLVPEHTYSLIRVEVAKGHRLLKLRNPMGEYEWKGDWSDKSAHWTPELSDQLGHTEQNDGTFWMCWSDVCQYFTSFAINRYRDEAELVSIDVHQEPDHFVMARIAITSPGVHCFSICQRAERMFAEDSDYKYSCSRMILMRFNNG